MLSFEFNSKNSYTNYGIIVSSRPSLPSAKRRVDYIEIPGRDSNLRFDEGTYDDITIAVECSIKDSNISAKLDEIKNWLLSSVEADLVFSFQNDRKYIAQVVNSIDFSQVYKIVSRFVILFNCRPFKYAVSSSVVTINTGGGITIVNDGTLPSKPKIKAFCTGSGAFTINGIVVTLTDIAVPSVVIDSQIEDAYYDNSGTLVNMNNSISGDFPILDVGNNNITFSGGVTKLEITPNWRWL